MWRETSRSVWNKGVKVVAMSWRRLVTWCCTIFLTQPWGWGMIPDVFLVQRILAFRNGMPELHERPVCIKHGVLDLILCGGEAPRRQNSRSQSCELRVPVKSTKEWISSTEASLWVTWIKCRCWKGQFWQKSQTDTHCQNGSHSYRSKANQTKVCTDTMGQRATVSHFRDGWIWQENTGELGLAAQKCVRKQNFLN